jgi:hypothetical protein
MWIKKFFDNTNEAIEKEDRLIVTRRKFFFLSAAAVVAAPAIVPVEFVFEQDFSQIIKGYNVALAIQDALCHIAAGCQIPIRMLNGSEGEVKK